MYGYSRQLLDASSVQVKEETQCDRHPVQTQSGARFLPCWLPALVPEQGQVGTSDEDWALGTQLSTESELCLGSFWCNLLVLETGGGVVPFAFISLYSESCYSSPAAHMSLWGAGGRRFW